MDHRPVGGEDGPGRMIQAPAELRAAGRTERWVAVGLILAFLVLIAVLIQMRSDAQWDRLVYLLGGVEALVFAGAGALFGTSVQRSHVASALETAEAQRKRADRESRAAANGRAVTAAVRAKANMRQRTRSGTLVRRTAEGESTRRSARSVDPAASAPAGNVQDERDVDLYELAAMCDELMPVQEDNGDE